MARKRSDTLLKTSRSDMQARAASSDVQTSLGPEAGHDVDFLGQDDTGKCVPCLHEYLVLPVIINWGFTKCPPGGCVVSCASAG